jgi:hypothetical protein
MAGIFGFTIGKKEDKSKKKIESIVPPSNDDGSIISAYSAYGLALDLDGVVKDENQLIRQYRIAADYPDCSSAIDDITNEAITFDGIKSPVSINLDGVKYSEGIKNKIRDEFNDILNILDFNKKGYDFFRQWYIDGRMYFHIVLDKDNLKNGIVEVRYIDPRKIRKIKEVKKVKDASGNDVHVDGDSYYLYNDKGFTSTTNQGIKLSTDSVIYVNSGLIDSNTGLAKSYLHKCVKLVNQLKMAEDAMIIYRYTRAPERRVFYIDVGSLPKIKADQYVQDTMARFRNKLVYNSTTGEISEDRKSPSMIEDYWMPRRDGSKGTEIVTLPGGQSLGQIDDVVFFQNKLYKSLNVPASRLTPESGFNIGRSSEISRDEVKFAKFIGRLRHKFAALFIDLLRIQTIGKGIVSSDDWEELERILYFEFAEDNHYAELKDNEIIQGRIQTLQLIDPYVGKYYSVDWIRKNILHQTEEEIKQIDKENKEDSTLQANAEQQTSDQSTEDNTQQTTQDTQNEQ